MSDSAMSDADKVPSFPGSGSERQAADISQIRMKRLAKLGGSQPSNATPSSADNTDNPASATSLPTAEGPAAASLPEQQLSNSEVVASNDENPFSQLGMKTGQEQKPQEEKKSMPQIKVHPRPTSPAKRERDGSEKPRSRTAEKPSENLDIWQDRTLRQVFRVTLKPEEGKDLNGHPLVFLASTREDLVEGDAPILLNTEVLEGAITEAASEARDGKPFEYLLQCFKRVSRAIRGTKYTGSDDPKHEILQEVRRLCTSYCIFAVTMPEMFGENVATSNPLVDHLLADPECDTGICTDFLSEASGRFEEDESIKEAIVGAAQELSRRLSGKDMLGEYQYYMRAMRNLIRFPKIVDALTESPMWIPDNIEPQDIEMRTILGPFFRLSPMQTEVAQNYFSAPKTRDRGFITNAQNAVRLTLRTHQAELFQVANAIVRAGTTQRERILDWFALCVNKNHKKRAMRVDPKAVSTDGFMMNVASVLDQLCEPFMDAQFNKIDRIDAEYLRRNPRVDISDETKINADQKMSDEFFSQKADGTSNFISEVFFLTVAAHHYGPEAAQSGMGMTKKSIQRMEQELEQFEKERHKYINVSETLPENAMTMLIDRISNLLTCNASKSM